MKGKEEVVAGYTPAQLEPTEDGRSRFFPRAELPAEAGREAEGEAGREAEGRAPIELCVMQSVRRHPTAAPLRRSFPGLPPRRFALLPTPTHPCTLR